MTAKTTKNGRTSVSKKNAKTEFLGPVEDLESYVKADWWRHIFNANYLRTDGDVVEDLSITKSEIDVFIDVLQPDKDSHFLDLCCGQGRHSLELARRGFTNITGLDRSHYLINRARVLSRQEGKYIVYKEGDARKLPFATDTFDYVLIAGNSFGYFETSNDDLQVLLEVRRVLRPYGTLLIDVTDGTHMKETFQPRSWEWIDKKYFVCRERSLSANEDRLISREVITHVKQGVIADQFYAERLYSKESLAELLGAAKFADVTFQSEMFVDSQRNQDLGMMAKRLIVSTIARKNLTPVKKTKKDVKNIVVVMGDPGKSDRVKPSESFDEDDFVTIDRMKKALAELKDYAFTYHDHHDTFIQDMLKAKGKADYVLNLCDEGFNNDAVRELHVPALLEMLQIPYTGGTPQCLAFCYDKSLVRGIASEMDIPVPTAFLIKPEDIGFIDFPIDFPVIVKPNIGDSSFGISQNSVCFDLKSLESAILHVRETLGFNKPILVEQYLTGKDLSVGIIGNPPESYTALPIIEEDYSSLPLGLPPICGYEAKWDPESPYWNIRSIPAGLPEEVERFLVASCVKLFERLECHDYARFDWRMDAHNTPRLLEVNPNPGWCWDGHLAKMAKIGGMSYTQMLQEILIAAERRLLGQLTY